MRNTHWIGYLIAFLLICFLLIGNEVAAEDEQFVTYGYMVVLCPNGDYHAPSDCTIPMYDSFFQSELDCLRRINTFNTEYTSAYAGCIPVQGYENGQES